VAQRTSRANNHTGGHAHAPDHRYRSTPRSAAQLREQITPRTVSRLTEMCDELPLTGADHRMDLRIA
jgi:hypothetical protein